MNQAERVKCDASATRCEIARNILKPDVIAADNVGRKDFNIYTAGCYFRQKGHAMEPCHPPYVLPIGRESCPK